ncbi:MAG: hypothetical protein NTV54_00125 [Ignavibacteriales bacterium]|nr:hypothetical protein [Ignavibacteriales bacterium]
MNPPTTYTILSRTDTGEYLSQFLFCLPDPPMWSKDIDAVFRFQSHSDAEANARLILGRLGDPKNEKVGLKSAKVEKKKGEIVVGTWYSMVVW